MADILTRIVAMQKPGARLEDCRRALADAEAELTAASERHAAAEQRRFDLSLSDDDARLARLDAEELSNRIERLRLGIEALKRVISAKEKKAIADGRRQAYDQIRHRRDKLAAELRDRVPSLIAELVNLNHRLVASNEEVDAVNRSLPKDAEWLAQAEAMARGCGEFWPGGYTPALKLINLKLPHFDREGLAWPDVQGEQTRRAEAERVLRREARQTRRKREAADAARWAWYDVTTKRGGGPTTVTIETRDGPAMVGNRGLRCLQMDAAQVDAAQQAGVVVTPARLSNYRVWANGAGFLRRPIATALGQAEIGREPTDHLLTEAQAQAALAAGFDVDEIILAEVTE